MQNNVLRRHEVAMVSSLMTEYHPRSERAPLFQAADEFGQSTKACNELADDEPWRPFQTEADMEFAEIALRAGLNATDVNALLCLISRVANRSASITFNNENDLRRTCDRAAQELTPVSPFVLRFLNDLY